MQVDKKTSDAFKKMFQKKGLMHSNDSYTSEKEFKTVSVANSILEHNVYNEPSFNDENYQDSIQRNSTEETSRIEGLKHS